MAYQGEVFSCWGFEVDIHAGELRKDGQKLKLQNQPFQVLIALLERPGEVVTREDLRRRLWPADTFVDFNNGLNIAIRKLRRALDDDAEKPRYIETLPGRGYRVLGSVERVPETMTKARAEASAGDALRPPDGTATRVPALEPDGKWQPPPAPRTSRLTRRVPTQPSRLRAVLAIALCLLLLIAALLYGKASQRMHASFETPTAGSSLRVSPAASPSIAVLGFENLSTGKGEDRLSAVIAERLSMDLAEGDRLRTISAENVARAKGDLALPDSDSYAPNTLSRIHQNLGADYVVAGAYFVTGRRPAARVRLDLRLQDVKSGLTLVSLSRSGAESDLLALVSSAGAELREKLGLATVVWQQAATVPTSVAFDGANLWVAASAKNMVVKLVKDREQPLSFPVKCPYAMAYDGAHIWATNQNSDTVTKLDAPTGRVLGVFPVGVHPAGIAFDGKNVWVANFKGNTVSKLNTSGGLEGTFRVGQNPHELVYDGSHIWVTNEFSNNVMKLSINGEILGTYNVGSQPWGLVFDGAHMWVANQNSNNVMELTLDGALVATVPTGSGPHGLVFDGNYVWAMGYNDGSVTKIQARTAVVVGTFPTGGSGPQMGASDGVNVWVANSLSGTVSRM